MSSIFFDQQPNLAINGQFVVSEFTIPQKTDLIPPDCYIGGDGFIVIDSSAFSTAVSGSCREIKTPKGVSVYLMSFKITSEKKLAAIILENTLITISGYNFSEQELLDMIDGLEETNPSDIKFKVNNRTIGR